jgi:hypothetical protein
MRDPQLPNGHGWLICKYCRRVIVACNCKNHLKEFFGICSMCEGKKELSPRERFMLYSRGWMDGGSCHAMKHPEVEEYSRGYTDGSKSRNEAILSYCKEIGYNPQILRVQDG